jgi:hypothetical protein
MVKVAVGVEAFSGRTEVNERCLARAAGAAARDEVRVGLRFITSVTSDKWQVTS